MVLPRWLVVKNPPANAGNARVTGLSPGSGRSLCIGSGNLLQCSCLKISMNKRAGRDQATERVHTHTQILIWSGLRNRTACNLCVIVNYMKFK